MRAFGRMYGGAMSLDDVSTYTNLNSLYIYMILIHLVFVYTSGDMECRAQDHQDQTGGTGHTNAHQTRRHYHYLFALSFVLTFT